MNPYRKVVAERTISAMSQAGEVRLSVSPGQCRLRVGKRVWTIAQEHLSISKPSLRGALPGKGAQSPRSKPKEKTRSIKLAGRLLVARAWPTREAALWLEHPAPKKGRGVAIVERLVGLPPVPGMEEEQLDQWKKLESLTTLLIESVQSWSRGTKAIEFGKGQHRVLLCEGEDSASVFARPIFRERPRLVSSLGQDGGLTLYRGNKSARVHKLGSDLQLVSSGDRIQFCHRDGKEVGSLFLPWVGKAEREELTRRLQLFFLRRNPQTAQAEERDEMSDAASSENALNRRLRTQTSPG